MFSVAALEVELTWLLIFGLVTGLGLGLWQLLAPGPKARCGLFRAFWLGWCFELVVLEVWHLALPVDARADLALAPLALAGWATAVRRGKVQWSRTPRATTVATWLAGVLLVAYAAARALARPGNPDSYLYYFQTVRWAQAYPVVKGLGNFYVLLAFNNAYHLYVACLDVGPWLHRSQHIANGVLYLACILPGLAALVRLLARRSEQLELDFLWALVLALGLDQLIGGNLTSPAADGALWCMRVVVIMTAIAPLFRARQESSAHDLLQLAVLCGGATIAKSSAIVFAGPAFAFGLALTWRSTWRGPGSARARRALAACTAIFAVAWIPWAITNILQTGYPFFPSTHPDLRVGWRVPEADLQKLVAYIQGFARYRRAADYVHDPRYAWVSGWFRHEWLDDRTFLLPVTFSIVAAVLSAVGFARSRRAPPPAAALVLLVVVTAAWWLGAPDLRFLEPVPWLTAGSLGLWAFSYARVEPERLRPALLGLVAAAVGCGAVIGVSSDSLLHLPRDFAPPKHESYVPGRLASGEEVHVDTGGCVELPCTPKPEHVHTYAPGDFAHGFYSDRVRKP